MSPSEHKALEGSLGLQLYYYPANGKWFLATHFEPKKDSAFAWLQADGRVPTGSSVWKLSNSDTFSNCVLSVSLIQKVSLFQTRAVRRREVDPSHGEGQGAAD